MFSDLGVNRQENLCLKQVTNSAPRRVYLMISGLMIKLLFIVGILGLAAPILAADSKEVNDLMRKAERLFFSGKAQEADALLKQAEQAAEAILQGTDEAEKTKVKRLESQLKNTRKNIDRKLGAVTESKPSPAASTPAGAPASGVPGALPENVTSNMSSITRHLDQAQTELDKGEIKQAKSALGLADQQISTVERNYARLLNNHPEMEAIKQRRKALNDAIGGVEAKKAADLASEAQAAGINQAQTDEDVKQFLDTFKKYQDKLFVMQENSYAYGATIDTAKNAQAFLNLDENDILAAVKTFTDKYGADGEAIRAILKKFGVIDRENIGHYVDKAIDSMRKYEKARQATAAQMVKDVKSELSGKMEPHYKANKIREFKEILQIGQQIYPNNPELNQLLAEMDDQIMAAEKGYTEKIDKTEWKSHISDFAGPGDVKSLAKAALEYFQNSPGWGKNAERKMEVLAVSVQGQWQIAERNVFGYVTSWRLPIHLAYTTPEYKQENLAKVIELSAIALKGNPGEAKKAPPFENYWVGNSWMIRLNKVK